MAHEPWQHRIEEKKLDVITDVASEIEVIELVDANIQMLASEDVALAAEFAGWCALRARCHADSARSQDPDVIRPYTLWADQEAVRSANHAVEALEAADNWRAEDCAAEAWEAARLAATAAWHGDRVWDAELQAQLDYLVELLETRCD